MRGKSRLTIAVLLCITMIVSTLSSSAAVFAESSSGESTAAANIENYLDDAQIWVDGGVYNPDDSLSPEGSFSVKLFFSEKVNGRQFPDHGTLTYTIPSSIQVRSDIEKQPIKDTNKGEKIGTYTIKNGKITVNLDSDYVTSYQNIDTFLTFEGSFSKDATEGKTEAVVEFTDSIKLHVKLEEKANLTIQKTAGKYDYQNDTVDYTIEVSTDYTANDVIVSDHMNENLSLIKGTIRVTNKDGGTVSFKSVDDVMNVTNAEKQESKLASWAIKVGTMKKGETYTITYQGKISDKAKTTIEASDKGTYDSITISNTAYAKSSNALEVSATPVSETLKFKRITKKVEKENGKLKWTVTVNDSKHITLDGYTIKDTFESDKDTDTPESKKLSLNTKIPMAVTKDGKTVKDENAFSWSNLAGDSNRSWSYTFPPGTGKSTYTFVYFTNIPESDSAATAENGKGESFKNNVTLSKDSIKYKGSATYTAPGAGFLKKKFRDSDGYSTATQGKSIVTDGNGDIYLRWTSEITVPASGLKHVKFSDAITKDNYKKHEFLPSLEAALGTPSKNDGYNKVVIDSKEPLQNVTLDQHGADGFDLYFADTANTADSSLPASSSSYMVKITYYTKVTAEKHTNETWRNVGTLLVGNEKYSDWEDYDDKLYMEGSKTGKIDPATGEITWTVELKTNRQGENSDVTVEDTISDNQEFDLNSRGTLDRNHVFLNGNKLDASQITKEGTKYNFHLGNLKNSTTYTLVYKTKIKSETLAESGKKVFENVARVTDKNLDLSLPAEVSTEHKIVRKELSSEPTRYNNYQAEFTITLNPYKMLLNSKPKEEAKDYILTDTYSNTMEMDLKSFVITRDDSEVLSADKGDYIISHQEGKETSTLEIQIIKADGHKYTIQYKALVLGAVGDKVNYENKAVLSVGGNTNEDGVADGVTIEKLSSEAGSNASELFVSVQKYDSTNTDINPEGATFNLYKDSVSEENLLGTETTAGKDGIAVFGQSGGNNNLTLGGKAYYLESGVRYILTEAQAPDEYEKTSKTYEFQLWGKDGAAALEGVKPYQVGHTFSVANEKYNFYINKEDATGNSLKGAEFSLFNDQNCKTDAVLTVKEDKDGHFTFKGLKKGTYYLKETKVPDNYYDPQNVYAVTIDQNGDATMTLDGQTVAAEGKTYTITNTLAGEITVTKDVKEDGIRTEDFRTYHVALFNSNKERVSEIRHLKMNGDELVSTTFKNLEIGTYYVAETNEAGEALPNKNDDGRWEIAYKNQVVTLTPKDLKAESSITNNYYSAYYRAGSIDVTKHVTLDGKDFESNSIFYVGLYADKACTDRIGDIKPLVLGGKANTTVTFSDLTLDHTYYVAETDAEGNVITDSQKQLNCKMTIDNNQFNLTEENTTGSAVITNDFHDEEQFYYGGQVTVNKTTTYNGKAYKTDDVFYAALFADKAHTERVSEVKALAMKGKSSATISFENLAYGTYYLAETDKDGKALTDLDAAKLGFTNLLDEEIKLDADTAEIDLENQMTEEYVSEHGGDPDAAANGSSTQTGDDSNMTLLLLGLLIALTVMGITVIGGRRRKNS